MDPENRRKRDDEKAAKPEVALRCEGVRFVYPGGIEASKDIDLTLHRGELFCLLGPNGAGKTTLIRQITTQLRPTAGHIFICGLDAHRHPAETKRRLGVIPQSVGLFEGLTVEEHLAYFAPLKELSRAEITSEVERVLGECGLSDLRGRVVRALSGGEKRRVLVALALLGKPEVLVLDEPSVGLDPVARRELWRTIERQKTEGRTTLLTTHYMDEAERLADRLGFIDDGALTSVGTLQDFRDQVAESVRVSEMDPVEHSIVAHHYFDNMQEAQDFARDKALTSYSVSFISLDDIYMRLVGRALDDDK